MNIMAIIGSNRNGNTKHLVDNTVATIKRVDENICVEKVHLKDLSMQFCNGCLKCDFQNECVLNDDMTTLAAHIRNVDAFIFATPTRWGLLSGEMKVFMDRLNPLAINEELQGKKAIIFAVGQSDQHSDTSVESAAKSVKTFCENASIEVVDSVLIYGCYEKDDVMHQTEYLKLCENAGIHLINSFK